MHGHDGAACRRGDSLGGTQNQSDERQQEQGEDDSGPEHEPPPPPADPWSHRYALSTAGAVGTETYVGW